MTHFVCDMTQSKFKLNLLINKVIFKLTKPVFNVKYSFWWYGVFKCILGFD